MASHTADCLSGPAGLSSMRSTLRGQNLSVAAATARHREKRWVVWVASVCSVASSSSLSSSNRFAVRYRQSHAFFLFVGHYGSSTRTNTPQGSTRIFPRSRCTCASSAQVQAGHFVLEGPFPRLSVSGTAVRQLPFCGPSASTTPASERTGQPAGDRLFRRVGCQMGVEQHPGLFQFPGCRGHRVRLPALHVGVQLLFALMVVVGGCIGDKELHVHRVHLVFFFFQVLAPT